MANFHAPAKVLNFIDTRPKDNEVKGAVKLDSDVLLSISNVTEPRPLFPLSAFATFNKQDGILSDFISLLLKQLNLPDDDSNEFALQFEDGKFVTESNKTFIKQGFLLKLSFSPAHFSRKILNEFELKDNSHCIQSNLSLLLKFLSDPGFIEIFNVLNGTQKLVTLVENDFFEGNVGFTYQILRALILIMKNVEMMPWNVINEEFVSKISAYLNGSSKMESNDSLNLSLDIILAIMENHEASNERIQSHIQFESLIRHLENSDERILHGILRLMNNLYSISHNEEQRSIIKALHSKPFIVAIDNVFQRESKKVIQSLQKELNDLQRISLDELRMLALRPPTDEIIGHVIKMPEFEQNDLENSETQKDADAFKAIVQKTPPGMLALIAILEYIKPGDQKNSKFEEIQTEIRPRLWPVILAHLSLSLTSILGICQSLESKKGISTSQKTFKIIFKYERPFHVLFAAMVDLFNRTWREMNGSEDDVIKAISIVSDQFARAMDTYPNSVEELGHVLQKRFSYFQMLHLWNRERLENEDLELKSVSIQRLKNHLRPSIEHLVLQRKKNFLKKGETFMKVDFAAKAQPIKDVKQFWKLEENERYFSFCDLRTSGDLDSSTCQKIHIGRIQSVLYGAELNSYLLQNLGVKISKKNIQSVLKNGICLILGSDSSEYIMLTANDDTNLESWINGLNAVCFPQSALLAPHIKLGVEQLLTTNLRVALLDVPSESILDNLPIPTLPSDYSWVHKKPQPL